MSFPRRFNFTSEDDRWQTVAALSFLTSLAPQLHDQTPELAAHIEATMDRCERIIAEMETDAPGNDAERLRRTFDEGARD